jgi:hypothetical protein
MKKIVLSVALVATLFVLNSCEKEECDCPSPPPVAVEKTLTMQPDGQLGQDSNVFTRIGNEDAQFGNYANSPELGYSQWTYAAEGFGQGTARVFIKFDEVATIPSDAVIVSAKLSLYGVATSLNSQGNSHYPGSNYLNVSPNNLGWVKRVIGDWQESTINWSNQPSITDEDQVEIPSSTLQWNYNVTDLDVTKLVDAMVKAKKNYGFNLRLQDESIYKSVFFSSSDVTDATKRPKLVVVYKK